ncbi:MAG: alpha/beta fold hydrolase [Candidatus Hodarchaeales archaeon]|jgi:pimeloyl-ACP methyl ester carboxylesterase
MVEVRQSEEKAVKANNIDIVFDTFSIKSTSSPALLLIMGLGSQMILWDEIFCKELASKGYYIIRYDNRDTGLSTKFDDAEVPNPMELFQKVMQGVEPETPYKLLDMAKDAVGLLDALGIDSAHIVGASMGGMIAQTVAIHFPERVKTLTSIMSSTGNPELPQPEPEAMAILVTPPPASREENIENSLKTWNLLNGSVYPLDEDQIRLRSAKAFDRSFYPQGTARQLAAILASGSRNEELQKINIPTLVIHGDIDPLVPVEAGRDTANMIPNAKLLIIEGMGHNIPPQIAPQIIEAIVQHTSN